MEDQVEDQVKWKTVTMKAPSTVTFSRIIDKRDSQKAPDAPKKKRSMHRHPRERLMRRKARTTMHNINETKIDSDEMIKRYLERSKELEKLVPEGISSGLL